MTDQEKIENAENRIYYYCNKFDIKKGTNELADIILQLVIIKQCSSNLGVSKGFQSGKNVIVLSN